MKQESWKRVPYEDIINTEYARKVLEANNILKETVANMNTI